MPLWIEWIHAEQEKGTTMPVVPRIESPPTMPRRGFQVFCASASPPGIEISISASGVAPCAAATSSIASVIILRGTGLIAGSPGGIGRPGQRDRADARAGHEADAARRLGARRTVATISA